MCKSRIFVPVWVGCSFSYVHLIFVFERYGDSKPAPLSLQTLFELHLVVELRLDDTDIIQSKLPYLGDITNLWDIFTTPLYKDLVTSLYRPLLYMTFMIDTILGNQSPSTFHISNILFHLIAILLVFRLFLYFTATQKTALLLTAIFALHPIHVHAVAWISGRNDILLAINLLLIIIAYLTALNSSKQRYLYLHFFFFFPHSLSKKLLLLSPFCW